ncbi:MAG: SDR family NAD(P)-dependent oxidoreductase, partial [Methylovulum sp.]|nr:SDR family NAD(P)-dependent oxidoreductase [Methylovulum sp.]
MPRDFSGQVAIQQFVNDLVRQSTSLRGQAEQYLQSLLALAELYCQGYHLPWQDLYNDKPAPRRLCLPTYPFAREHYWVNNDAGLALPPELAAQNAVEPFKVPLPSAKTPASPVRDSPDLLAFTESWQPVALNNTGLAVINTLLCLLPDSGYQQGFLASMQKLAPQTRLIFMLPSVAYQKLSATSYSVPRADKSAFERAFASIGQDFPQLDALLYGWALVDNGYSKDTLTIVALLQALVYTSLPVSRLLLAGLADNGLPRCYVESWLGFAKSLPLVLPKTQTAVTLLDAATTDPVAVLWHELQAPKLHNACYQGQQRQQLLIQATPLPQLEHSRIKARGTYLIIGGCGGLGMIFANYLAKTYTAKLILTGRSALDGRKQALLNALQTAGAEVCYVQADVCDLAAMTAGLKQVPVHFGDLDGVIHAAGLMGSTSINKPLVDFQQVLSPKIDGTLALEHVLAGKKLDFVCYFSSSSAILGDFGSCDYAIGNRFLMAYAQHRNNLYQQGQCFGQAIVINWPLWRSGGMGFADEGQTEFYLKSSGQSLLEAPAGLDLFERFLSQPQCQHLVLSGQVARIRQFLGLPPLPPVVSEPPAATPPDLYECVTADVSKLVAQHLKLAQSSLDAHANLADVGFDS